MQEGTYRFRLPPSAAVGDFAVWDGLVRVPGVILEKQRARAIYEELTRQRIDPGLLQQGEEDEGIARRGGAAFSARVSPIPPWATKRLEMQFQQEVPFREGRAEFRLALRPDEGEPPVAGTLDAAGAPRGRRARPSSDAFPLRRDGPDFVFAASDARLDRDLVVRLAPRSDRPAAPHRLSQPRGSPPRRARPRPVGEAVGDPARARRLLPPRDDAARMLRAPRAARRAASREPRDPLRHVALRPLVGAGDGLRPAGARPGIALAPRPLRARGVRRKSGCRDGPRPRRPRRQSRAGTRGRCARGRSAPAATSWARSRSDAVSPERAAGCLLLTDGPPTTSAALGAARGSLPLFTALTGEETPEAYRTASTDALPPGSSDADESVFLRRVVSPPEPASAGERASSFPGHGRRAQAAGCLRRPGTTPSAAEPSRAGSGATDSPPPGSSGKPRHH